mmetsp:Transcript_79373/g.200505  ORF Transcript_79373/g.200505 Transcript_79373/m.200505 type:complete len:225 (-) Transcript_79373:277-951(-)
MSKWQIFIAWRHRTASSNSCTTLLIVCGKRSNHGSSLPPPQSSIINQYSELESQTPCRDVTSGSLANLESIRTSFMQSPDRCTVEPFKMRLPATARPVRRSRRRKTDDMGVSSRRSSRSKVPMSNLGTPPPGPAAAAAAVANLAFAPAAFRPPLPGGSWAAWASKLPTSSHDSDRGTGGSAGGCACTPAARPFTRQLPPPPLSAAPAPATTAGKTAELLPCGAG